MKRLFLPLLASLTLSAPAYAQFWDTAKPKPAPKPAPSTKSTKKPSSKAIDEETSTARPDVQETENLYVALFTPQDRLFWTGKITGKITFYGMTRDRLEFTAECDKASDKNMPCHKWSMKEANTVRPQTGTSYISFVIDGRLLVWPHTFVLSTAPFTAYGKSVVEKP